MDSREFSEWIAYYRLDPFGNERADMHAAQVCTTIVNRSLGKNETRAKVADLMADFDKDTSQSNVGAEVLAAFMQVKETQDSGN